MKVLLLEKQLVEANRLGSLVREAGHQVTLAANEAVARTALSDSTYGIAVFATQGGDEKILTLIKECRATSPKLLVAILGEASEDFLTRAYAAGIDLELRPASSALLLSRLRALGNLHRTSPVSKTSTTSIPKVGTASVDAVLRTAQSAAWRTAGTNMAGAASTFLTLAATTAEVPTDVGELVFGSAISLGNTEEQLEIRVAIGADHQSAHQLAVHMFGEGEDLAADMLGEVANIFMGILKSTLSSEGLAYTGGLPAAVAPELVLRPTVTYQHQSAFVLHVSEARLVVHVGLRSKVNSFLSPTALGEGMVLAKDVFNGRGVMLVTSGTRLSSSMADKLRNTLDPKARVEVMA